MLSFLPSTKLEMEMNGGSGTLLTMLNKYCIDKCGAGVRTFILKVVNKYGFFQGRHKVSRPHFRQSALANHIIWIADHTTLRDANPRQVLANCFAFQYKNNIRLGK